jgi:hypothetical protein
VSGGPSQGIGEGRRARYRGWLADSLGAKRPDGGWDFEEPNIDVRQLIRRRQLVIQEAAGSELTLAVVPELLAQRPAKRLRDAAVDLRFDLGRVDGAPDVLDRCITRELKTTGLRIGADALCTADRPLAWTGL